MILLLCGLACQRQVSPQSAFEHAELLFRHGDLEACQREARLRHDEFERSQPKWARKFRILEAKAALWRGQYEEARKLAQSASLPSDEPDLAVPILTIVGVADIRTRDFPGAERALNDASRLCDVHPGTGCGELLQAQGLLASERLDSISAEHYYQLSLSFARAHGDAFLESGALLNLGAESLSQGHFDEALDRSAAAYQAAQAIGARFAALTARSNIGWAYYRLGDADQALQLFVEAEKTARDLDFVYDRENELTNIGYIYMDRHQFEQAAQSFEQALDLAESIKAQQDIYNALRVLARLNLQMEQIDPAARYAARALQMARESKIHVDELYPRLVQGQIAAQRGQAADAENTYRDVASDPACPVYLKWEAEHSLARLLEDQGSLERADRQYRAALATFEGAREAIRHESSQLSFLTNGWRIYDDYVHFLVERGRSEEALRWADYSRARTLAESLGGPPARTAFGAPPLRPREIARAVQGTLLFYWLGERQSYLWAISERTVRIASLVPRHEIDVVARRYRDALAGLPASSSAIQTDGLWLYRTLIAPAQAVWSGSGSVFVLPDSSLNNLNFDALIAPDPAPHYWIEDVTIANSSSLRLLGASYRGDTVRRNLLLIGNNVSPDPRYPELAKAAAQMQAVAAHFPATHVRVFEREQATPKAYLTNAPEQYSFVHFVAHGTASRLSPLDSAIILSKDSQKDESFKLYARDIIQHPLRADLVTISSCFGAGTKFYSGEGLVGLSWAFLRAGAHNVIAALWQATDTPTEQLMARLYDELNRGASPDAALRSAKLALLHEGKFSHPVYWAPFQLYTQGRAGSPRAFVNPGR